MRRGAGPRWALGVALLLVTTACADVRREQTLVVVRSSLPAELLEYAEDAFEAANPTVDVRIVVSSAEASLAELRSGSQQVDVWWGAPGTMLAVAANEGRFRAYRPPWLQQPGVGQPDPEGRWQVSLISPFVIAFNREQVPLARAPTDWIDLFHFRWADEVLLLDPARNADAAHFVGAMIVQSLRDDDDIRRGFDWLLRLDASVDAYASDASDIIRSLGTGEALLSILPRHVVEEARHGAAPWIHYRLPESGTPMLSRGIAVTADAVEPELARRFVDFTGTMDLATVAKLHTRWMPGHGDVDMSRFPPDFEIDMPWSPYALSPDTIATELDGWIERWDLLVRDRGEG